LWTWTPRNSIIRPDTVGGPSGRDFNDSAIPQFTALRRNDIDGNENAGWYNRPMRQTKPINPFYVASLPVGIIFAITACAYVVMTVRGSNPHHAEATGLMALLEQQGLAILLAEIAALGLLTLAAITSDDFWTRRHEAAQQRDLERREPNASA
jgi:hypothetical protein